MFARMLIGAAALSVAAASPSSAAVYNFSYTVAAQNWNAPAISVSGTYKISDTANSMGFYRITGLTGTRGGQSMSLVNPGVLFGNDYTDNLLKMTNPYFTAGGLGYSAGGVIYDLYSFYGLLSECSGNCWNGTTADGFKVTRSISPVPEPASWMLMMGGLGVLGVALKRRKANGSALALRPAS